MLVNNVLITEENPWPIRSVEPLIVFKRGKYSSSPQVTSPSSLFSLWGGRYWQFFRVDCDDFTQQLKKPNRYSLFVRSTKLSTILSFEVFIKMKKEGLSPMNHNRDLIIHSFEPSTDNRKGLCDTCFLIIFVNKRNSTITTTRGVISHTQNKSRKGLVVHST